MKGQMTLDMFLEQVAAVPAEPEPEEAAPKIDFSCFACYRSEAGGVRYGECAYNHDCKGCEAYYEFYKKADEYHDSGEPWNVSVALAREYFKIPTVPEYTVKAYKKGVKKT